MSKWRQAIRLASHQTAQALIEDRRGLRVAMWASVDNASAFVKRYVEEAGRGDVLQPVRRDDLVTSAVLPVRVAEWSEAPRGRRVARRGTASGDTVGLAARIV